MPDTDFNPNLFYASSRCISGFPSTTGMSRICSLNLVLMFLRNGAALGTEVREGLCREAEDQAPSTGRPVAP